MKPELPIENCYEVIAGRFLAGEYPGDKEPMSARHRIRRFMATGTDTFFDLTEPHELVPYDATLAQEAALIGKPVEYRRIAIPDLGVPSDAGVMSELLDALDDALRRGQNAYVHCWGGVGRTGTVVGCYLRRHGATPEGALQQLARWWTTMPKRWRKPQTPETEEQRNYVRKWKG